MARAQMRFIFGDELSESEQDRLAEGQLLRSAWLAESRYHPDLATRQPVSGLEHLRQALKDGSGCVLSFLHHGDYEASFGSVARHGIPIHVVANSDVVAGPAKEWVLATRRLVSHVPGTHLFDVRRGSAGIREQLRLGRCVAVALDVPGSTYYRFLGKDLLMSSSGVHIACELDCPVVPMTFSADQAHPLGPARIELGQALYPRDFESAQSLSAALAKRLESSVLDWPEGVAWQDTEFRLVRGLDDVTRTALQRHAAQLEGVEIESFTFKSQQDPITPEYPQ